MCRLGEVQGSRRHTGFKTKVEPRHCVRSYTMLVFNGYVGAKLTNLQATQAVYAKVSQQSLLDFLR